VRPRWDDDDWHEDAPRADRYEDWFDDLAAEGLVSDVLMPLRSGKEASVYVCRAGTALDGGLLAAKVYHAARGRAFRNDAVYKHGRVILNGHDRRAVARRTSFGRQAEEAMWIEREWDHLRRAHRAGVDVPRPVVRRDRTILMEFVGEDPDLPAPQLKDVDLEPGDARELLDRILWNVETMLRDHLVHSDLSPYNVLVSRGRPVLIDLPQAVDARTNRNSLDLLRRDLRTMCDHFARRGVHRDPARLVDDIWSRYLFARL
jgi:RIO kinase 1